MILAALSVSFDARAHDVGTAAYFVPLVGDYAIRKVDPWNISGNDVFQLVRTTDLSSGYPRSDELLARVKRIAVRDRVIFGETEEGFFALDASAPDAEPQTFTSRDAWIAALRLKQIDSDAALQSPDALAAHVPDDVLRPWDYRLLHNLLGVPDAGWSTILQILGLLLSFVLGLINRPKGRAISIAAGLGIVVNIVGQMILAGEGPALCPGFVVFPLVFMLAAWLGSRARKIPQIFAEKSRAS